MPAKVKDEEIWKAWKGKFKLPAEAKGKSVGAWMVRKGDKVTMTVAVAAPSPIAVSRADEEGKVVVTGTLTTGAKRVVGFINRGAYAVSQCETDESVATFGWAADASKLFYVLEDESLWLVVVSSGSPTAAVEIEPANVSSVSFSPDARYLSYRVGTHGAYVVDLSASSPAPTPLYEETTGFEQPSSLAWSR